MTKYVVLRAMEDHDNALWQKIAEAEGTSASAAIKAALGAGDYAAEFASGRFVAVPARSWDPVKVEAKQAFSFS